MRSGDALWYALPHKAAPRSIFGLNELLGVRQQVFCKTRHVFVDTYAGVDEPLKTLCMNPSQSEFIIHQCICQFSSLTIRGKIKLF